MKRAPQQYCDECKRITGHVRGRRPAIDGAHLLLADAGPHCLPCLRYIVRAMRADPEGFARLAGMRTIRDKDNPADFGRALAREWPEEHAKQQ